MDSKGRAHCQKYWFGIAAAMLLSFPPSCSNVEVEEDTVYMPNGCDITIPLDTSSFLRPYASFPFTVRKSLGPIVTQSGAELRRKFLIDTGSNYNCVNPTLCPIPLLGTAFLRNYVAEIHYTPKSAHMRLSTQSCPRPQISEDVFARISQGGFYSTNPAANPIQIPVVYGKIGTTKTIYPLMLDTGDTNLSVPYGLYDITINDSFRKSLNEAGVVLTPLGEYDSILCSNKTQRRSIFMAINYELQLTNEQGTSITPDKISNPVFVVRSDDPCVNWISKSAQPIGLIGVGYFMAWRTIILDPFSETVWIKRNAEGEYTPPRTVVAYAVGPGRWGVGTAESDDLARKAALRFCENGSIHCTIADVLSPYGVRCLAVAISNRSPPSPFKETDDSLEDASSKVMNICKASGSGPCELRHAVCNQLRTSEQ